MAQFMAKVKMNAEGHKNKAGGRTSTHMAYAIDK